MPKVEPYRAWATFSFTARSGRINECDLFIATPGGLYLVELKGHPGEVVNHGATWRFRSSDRVRTITNPLHLTDLKSKELKGQLEWAVRQLHLTGLHVPRIEPAVFLSDPGLKSQLDEIQRLRVYCRDEVDSGLGWIWRDLLGQPPQRESQRITQRFSQHLPQLLAKIGISQSQAHLQFGDGWKLEPRAMDAGPTWEDRLARRDDIVREEGRVRVYLVSQQASEDAKRSVDRAARREYEVLQGINHRGIAQAVQIREHQGGPAILFRHRFTDLRLDAYLDVHGQTLTPEVRLDLVRQLAEAVRYAHNRSLFHRALSARSVYVSAKDDGSNPILKITDWQTAARDFDSTTMRSIGNSPLDDENVEDSAQVYLAPEFDMPYPDPSGLDIFGLGAVSYLILTGQPPAVDRATLIDRIATEGGMHPYAVAESLSNDLDQLVFRATRGEYGDRLDSAEHFLELLDQLEQDAAAAEGTGTEDSWAGIDPLTAAPGQAVDGDADGAWIVERVLGTGATGLALLVIRTIEDEDGEQARERRVFKVALDEATAAQLRTEAQILERVGGGAIVRLLAGPRELGGRTVLDLEYAGDRSLRALLKAEGKLTYHQLAEFGTDLFKALDQLAAKGVRHRDIKPDNFGVFRRADRTWELKLFDFSHAHVSDRDVKSGTRGYLDPFLGTPQRPDFDDHAERYAAAVTLHEMASGEQPKWGDNVTDPRLTKDTTPYLSEDLFEPALRDGLMEFFARALHRDIASRFDTFRQMEEAWREIFRAADATAPATTQATIASDTLIDSPGAEDLDAVREEAARAAGLETELTAAGLSPRAVSVAAGFNATTVGQLLDVPSYLITKARGAGAVVRKELLRRHKQWTAALLRAEDAHAASDDIKETAGQALAEAGPDARLRVDELAALLTPAPGRKGSNKAPIIRLTLGLTDPRTEGEPLPAWPTQVDIARRLAPVSQATVSRQHVAAIKEWVTASWLGSVRDELVSIVSSAGRIMTSTELAATFRARRGAADQDAEQALAKALAVVRAAVEAETWTGAGQREYHEPRLAVLRRGARVLIAMESLPGTNDPSPRELADYALDLGHAADALAAQDPLPGRGEVVRALRAVNVPPEMTPLADTRLVSLASAVARDAVASPRLDLYPRGLSLSKALRISQAAAGVRRDRGVTVDDLMARVQAWFPDLAALYPAPTHVRMEEALHDAGFQLEYDTVSRRFNPPAPTGQWPSSSTGTGLYSTGLAGPAVVGRTPVDQLSAKLAAAVEQGGFLALTLDQRQLPGTAQLLAASYTLAPIDVAAEFLALFRRLAAEHDTDWGKVLRADEKLTRTGQIPTGLRSYLNRLWPRLEQAVVARAASARTVVFLHNAGLLARYFDGGGQEMLARLQNAARRPADRPHGLWLLCPSEAPRTTPNLDGHTSRGHRAVGVGGAGTEVLGPATGVVSGRLAVLAEP